MSTVLEEKSSVAGTYTDGGSNEVTPPNIFTPVKEKCHFCGCLIDYHGVGGYCSIHEIWCSNDGKDHQVCTPECGCNKK